MAKAVSSTKNHETLHKRTSQGGSIPKRSSMNKTKKRSYKKYRGQGR